MYYFFISESKIKFISETGCPQLPMANCKDATICQEHKNTVISLTASSVYFDH